MVYPDLPCEGSPGVECRECSCVVERHYCRPSGASSSSVCSYVTLTECDNCIRAKEQARKDKEDAERELEELRRARRDKMS